MDHIETIEKMLAMCHRRFHSDDYYHNNEYEADLQSLAALHAFVEDKTSLGAQNE
jgi:hypothetical protein